MSGTENPPTTNGDALVPGATEGQAESADARRALSADKIGALIEKEVG